MIFKDFNEFIDKVYEKMEFHISNDGKTILDKFVRKFETDYGTRCKIKKETSIEKDSKVYISLEVSVPRDIKTAEDFSEFYDSVKKLSKKNPSANTFKALFDNIKSDYKEDGKQSEMEFIEDFLSKLGYYLETDASYSGIKINAFYDMSFAKLETIVDSDASETIYEI